MTSVLRFGGVGVGLGVVLARAGEGTVYEVVGHPEWVAKVFHPDLKDLAAKCAKVAAMVQSPPSGAVQSDGFAVLTWPLHVVDGDAGPVGYIMRRIDTTDAVEIHTVSNPSNRFNPLASAPQWTQHATWLHLVNVAANLCLAVDVVHHVDAVIGDFQERNILVSDTTRVTLVDCDSMQFTDGSGHQFLCGVGRPEFTAPELAGVNLAVTARQKPSDLFALAVHIHLLLMAGNHPFLRGTWTGGGEQPDAMTLARAGHWAGGPGSPLHTHPLAPPVDFLPDGIQRLFVRAFTDGARDPSRRPSAAEWRAALQGLQVRTCVRGHQLPVETPHCPWCRIDDERVTRKTQRAHTAQTQTIYKVAAPPGAPPTTPTIAATPWPATPSSGSGNGAKTTVTIVAAIAVLIAIIGIVAALTNNNTTTTTNSPYTTPTTTYQSSNGSNSTWNGPTSTTQAPAPRQWNAVIVGTCDEGGSCGVKQRNAPFSAAPRMYSNDLQDGMSVSIACQTTGDVRSSAGHGSSDIWYRLDDGAYVNSVYMTVPAPGIPRC
jgi:DNA-binding helix-hairpin-helix protein with protein kinase domain